MLNDNSAKAEKRLLSKRWYSLDEYAELLTIKKFNKLQDYKFAKYIYNLTGEGIITALDKLDKNTEIYPPVHLDDFNELDEIVVNKGIFHRLRLDAEKRIKSIDLSGIKIDDLDIKRWYDISNEDLLIKNINANDVYIYCEDVENEENHDLSKLHLSSVESNYIFIHPLTVSRTYNVFNSSFKNVKVHELDIRGNGFYDCVFDNFVANHCKSTGRLDKSCVFKNTEMDGVIIKDNDLSLDAAKQQSKHRRVSKEKPANRPAVNF